MNKHIRFYNIFYICIYFNIMTTIIETNHKNEINDYIYTSNDKRKIISNIKKLSKIEHIEVFKIIQKEEIKYSENSNGIFINFENIPNDITKKIDNFFHFYLKNKEELKKKDEIINHNKIILEQSNDIKTNTEILSSSSSDDEDNYSANIPDSSKIDGTKINLKKNKPTYTGIKAKIMKNYRNNRK